MNNYDRDSNKQREIIYNETVDDPTDIVQLSKFHFRVKEYGLDTGLIVALEKLKDKLPFQGEKREVYIRNLDWAENLAVSFITVFENILPKEAIDVLPKEWKQSVINYFVDNMLTLPKAVTAEEFCNRLGTHIAGPGFGNDGMNRRLINLLLGRYSDETGFHTAYSPHPVQEEAAFEEWSEARKKINELPNKISKIVNSLVSNTD